MNKKKKNGVWFEPCHPMKNIYVNKFCRNVGSGTGRSDRIWIRQNYPDPKLSAKYVRYHKENTGVSLNDKHLEQIYIFKATKKRNLEIKKLCFPQLYLFKPRINVYLVYNEVNKIQTYFERHDLHRNPEPEGSMYR